MFGLYKSSKKKSIEGEAKVEVLFGMFPKWETS
jgi:hypothetical protein